MSPFRRTRFIVFYVFFAIIELVLDQVSVVFAFRKTPYPKLLNCFLNSQETGIVAIIDLLIPITLSPWFVSASRTKLLIQLAFETTVS